MSNIQKFDLREWRAAPILLPLLFGLVMAPSGRRASDD